MQNNETNISLFLRGPTLIVETDEGARFWDKCLYTKIIKKNTFSYTKNGNIIPFPIPKLVKIYISLYYSNINYIIIVTPKANYKKNNAYNKNSEKDTISNTKNAEKDTVHLPKMSPIIC